MTNTERETNRAVSDTVAITRICH